MVFNFKWVVCGGSNSLFIILITFQKNCVKRVWICRTFFDTILYFHLISNHGNFSHIPYGCSCSGQTHSFIVLDLDLRSFISLFVLPSLNYSNQLFKCWSPLIFTCFLLNVANNSELTLILTSRYILQAISWFHNSRKMMFINVFSKWIVHIRVISIIKTWTLTFL